MINKIKVLIGEDIDDELAEILRNRAITIIYNYLNNERITRADIEELYPDAILVLVEHNYLTRDKKFIKSYSQGKRTVHYSDDVLTTMPGDVASLLPRPYLRFM